MTFAELIIFLLMGYGIYRLLRPMQEKLEQLFKKLFRAGNSKKPVIDVTDYKKKE